MICKRCKRRYDHDDFTGDPDTCPDCHLTHVCPWCLADHECEDPETRDD